MRLDSAVKTKIGAVIVSAGMSSRMGSFKPMLKMGSITVIKRIISTFRQAGVFPIIAVTGYCADKLEKHLSGTGVICIRNDNYENTEMIDSAALGLNYIKDKCERVFFTPVDVPLFTADTLRSLMRAGGDIAKPECGGKTGHPVLINCGLIEKLIELGSKDGLNKAMARYKDSTVFVPVNDEGILKDADTPGDYRAIVKYHNSRLLRPEVDISLAAERNMLDKTCALLLHLIDYDGSVKSACKRLNISYSKAWRMLGDFEDNLGFSLIERTQGGELGGSSRLTEKGRELLNNYELFSGKVKEYADKCFKDYFGDGLTNA